MTLVLLKLDLDLAHTLHVHRQTGQLHLDDVLRGAFEQPLIEIKLLVSDHDGIVLFLGVPSGKSINQIIFEKLRQRDLGNILDGLIVLSVIACKFLGLDLQPQLVPGAGIGGQIGDELRAVPLSQHDFQPFKQALSVKDVGHEELIDEHVHVVCDVVPRNPCFVLTEKLFEHPSNCEGFGRRSLVINRERNPLMFAPREGDRADTCIDVP